MCNYNVQCHVVCNCSSQQTLTLKNNSAEAVKVRLEIRPISQSGDYQVTHCACFLLEVFSQFCLNTTPYNL